MSAVFSDSRRHDDRMAEKVEHGIALLTRSGIGDASRYLRTRGVPPNVIGRVLTSAIARRQRERNLSA